MQTGSARQVWNGTKLYTSGGLMKKDLIKNKQGLIVSKKKSKLGQGYWNKGLKKWCSAVEQARKEMGIEGFIAIKKGTPYYKKAKTIYDAM